MKLDALRRALFVSATALYLYWVAVPLARWMWGGPGQSTPSTAATVGAVALALLVSAPVAVLYRVLGGPR